MDFEKNWKTRIINEAIYSEENKHHINEVSFKLPAIWKPILQKNKEKKNKLQNSTAKNTSPSKPSPDTSAMQTNQSAMTTEHFDPLAIEIELQNGDKVILATIYCPNGNPSLRLFRMINALSKQVIFLGDFNSKHKQFGCVKPNKSGQTLLNIAKDLKLFYVNQLEPNMHTREDPVHGTSDILDMAFITPGLSS